IAVPPQKEVQGAASAPASAPNWSLLFVEAGFDASKFVPVEPLWTPPFYADTRVAWLGVLPQEPRISIQIEAAAYRGKLVHFEIIGPWSRADRMGPEVTTRGDFAAGLILIATIGIIFGGAAFFVRR